MREKIVYFLGAGFSVPIGLPAMSNFLNRSKDLYFSDPEKYKNFDGIFKVIDSMAKAKNYYAVDLFNIEEILSLLEMEDYVGSSTHKEGYLCYLRDVILALTPEFKLATNHHQPVNHIFTLDLEVDNYVTFLANLFGLTWVLQDDEIFKSAGNQDAPEYGVISLNYDLVIENSLKLIHARLAAKVGEYLKFAKTREELEGGDCLAFAKLHGSVEPMTIIPPTWNKVASEEVRKSWSLAYALLADATQIRFLGYSLPTTDNYVRYLLESAVLKSRHLKRIDVICLDDVQKTVESRFRSAITFHGLRFYSGDIRRYLSQIRGLTRSNTLQREPGRIMKFDKIENFHEHFMLHPG